MFDPNNPMAPNWQSLGGDVQGVVNALRGQNQPHPGTQNIPGWRDAWQAAQPQQADFANRSDWRDALHGWRGQRRDFRMGNFQQPPAAAQPAPAQQLPTPVINGQLPLNPYGG